MAFAELLLTLSFLFTSPALSRDRTTITVEPLLRDLGYICIADGAAEGSFIVVNNSDEDVLVKVLPSCGCLKVESESLKITGHGRAELGITYDNVTPGKFSQRSLHISHGGLRGHECLWMESSNRPRSHVIH